MPPKPDKTKTSQNTEQDSRSNANNIRTSGSQALKTITPPQRPRPTTPPTTAPSNSNPKSSWGNIPSSVRTAPSSNSTTVPTTPIPPTTAPSNSNPKSSWGNIPSSVRTAPSSNSTTLPTSFATTSTPDKTSFWSTPIEERQASNTGPISSKPISDYASIGGINATKQPVESKAEITSEEQEKPVKIGEKFITTSGYRPANIEGTYHRTAADNKYPFQSNDAEVNALRLVRDAIRDYEAKNKDGKAAATTLYMCISKGPCDSCRKLIDFFRKEHPTIRVVLAYASKEGKVTKQSIDNEEDNKAQQQQGPLKYGYDDALLLGEDNTKNPHQKSFFTHVLLPWNAKENLNEIPIGPNKEKLSKSNLDDKVKAYAKYAAEIGGTAKDFLTTGLHAVKWTLNGENVADSVSFCKWLEEHAASFISSEDGTVIKRLGIPQTDNIVTVNGLLK